MQQRAPHNRSVRWLMLKEGPTPTKVVADFWGGLEKHMLASGTDQKTGKHPTLRDILKNSESGSYSLTRTHANWEQERWATERVRHRFHSWPPLRYVTRLLAIRSVCFKGRFRDARGPFFKDDPSPKSLRDNSLNRKRCQKEFVRKFLTVCWWWSLMELVQQPQMDQIKCFSSRFAGIDFSWWNSASVMIYC